MGNDAECFGLDQPLKPRTVFPASGVTFEGRQGALALLAAAFAGGEKFSNYNGGLELRPEPENKFDKYAIAVWAKVDGEFQPIGYVPKYSCPVCGQFIQVSRRGGKRGPDACHGCGISFVNMTQQNLNRWITDNFVAKGRPMACGLVWAGQGIRGNSSYGARIGLWWAKDGSNVVPQ